MSFRARPILSVLLVLGMIQWTSAGERWWVFFRDKPGTTLGTPPSHLSKRALERRARILGSSMRFDESDLPVNPGYVSQVEAIGARVWTTSRWLNAVSIEANRSEIIKIRALPIVISVQPIRTFRKVPEPLRPLKGNFLLKNVKSTSLDYGSSLTQNQTLNAIPLHNLGVVGYGVFIGMVDDGYNFHRSHPALVPINIIAEYDFVQGDDSVSFAIGEPASQGFHGAATLSVLAGYDPGYIIGPAFGAEFALAKTEVDGSETLITEEDNYVQGLEWLESLGVDIISSSLGYFDADTSTYLYSQLDGRTATTTKAARTLARKGVLLVTAMGNEGTYQPRDPTKGFFPPAVSVSMPLKSGWLALTIAISAPK